MNIGEGAATNAVLVNTTQSAIFHGANIFTANSITLADGKVYSISDYDGFREGKGIEVHTTQFDDYINLTGYTAADFYGTERGAPIDITTSVGNDVYIGPSFLNSDGKFVSVLDNQHYFEFADKLGLDASQGLQINLQGDGKVEILDPANGYSSQAYNIVEVQTSEHSNDTVHGDIGDNRFYSYGGTDTFHGSAGKDVFTYLREVTIVI